MMVHWKKTEIMPCNGLPTDSQMNCCKARVLLCREHDSPFTRGIRFNFPIEF